MVTPEEIEDRFPELAKIIGTEFKTEHVEGIGDLTVPFVMNEDHQTIAGRIEPLSSAPDDYEVKSLIIDESNMTNKEFRVAMLLSVYKHFEAENYERKLGHIKFAFEIEQLLGERAKELEHSLRFDDPVDVLVEELAEDMPDSWGEESTEPYIDFDGSIKNEGTSIMPDKFAAIWMDWHPGHYQDTLDKIQNKELDPE